MNNIFTENLKKFRLAKGFTQEQVADKLNVNSQTVSRWECGTTLPDVMTLSELAKQCKRSTYKTFDCGHFEIYCNDFFEEAINDYIEFYNNIFA